MKVYTRYLIYLFLSVNAATVFGQLNLIETFDDCDRKVWSAVQQNPNQSTWECTEEFDENTLGLTGRENEFDIWLISPEVDFSEITNPYLIFNYKNKIVNGELELMYSEEYSENATYEETITTIWNEIPIDIYPIGNDREINNFIRHPSINLAFLVGKRQIHFAFRFTNASEEFDILLDEISIVSDYYSEIQQSIEEGKRCADLKSDLSQLLIRDHQPIPYTGFEFDVWDSHFTTDLRLSDDGTKNIIWDMYSDAPDGQDPYEYIPGEDRDFGQNIDDEGLFYNREHTFPQSWWGGDQEGLQFSDIHFIIPTDKVVNAIRSNFPYGETDNPTIVTENGSKRGTSSFPGFRNVVFEPIDEYKGDIARISMYVATRYEEFVSEWEGQNGRGGSVMVREAYPFFEDWYINLLLKWHEMDPVSQKELDRNDAVFSIQKNRNPFIDHPEYAYLIWGNTAGEACDMVTSVEELNPKPLTIVYPNPVSSIMRIDSQEEFLGVWIYDTTGELQMESRKKPTIDVSSLLSGLYYVRVKYSNGDESTQKIIKL
jgi:endonuclease I